MVGRKTKFTTQNKITQGGRHGERKKKKKNNFVGHRGKNYEGKKDGEETNSKEKQDEGEPGRGKADFPLFFLF